MMKTNRSRKQVFTAVDFPVKSDEKINYAIIQWRDNSQNAQVGEFEYNFGVDLNTNCYRLQFESEMEYGFEGLTTEKVDILMDVGTLRPVTLNCKFESMDHVVELTGEYKRKKVVIRYVEEGIKDKWVEKVSFQVLDNYQLPFALRALDFNALELDCFSLVNALTLSIAEVECTRTDQERVATQIGEFECFRISLQVYEPVPFTQYLLYAIDPPHHLIKAVKGPLVFELRGIN